MSILELGPVQSITISTLFALVEDLARMRLNFIVLVSC